jgi:triphosphatase
MSQEVELKLELEPEAVEQLLRQPWLCSEEARPNRQLSVYFDTPRSEVRKHGYTLRVRSVGDHFIQTVKSLNGGAGLFERGEWESGVSGPEPDVGELAGTPLAGIDLGELQPIIRSEVHRTSLRLRPHGAEIELDIDQGVMKARGSAVPVSEVEIELLGGEPAAAVALARRIAAEVPVKLGVMSKAERGFALANGKLGKVIKAEPVAVRADMNVAQGFATIVSACLRHFRLNEPLVIEQRKMEALHQTRVAMRRLRSALSLFRPAIADDEFGYFRDELRWFTGELGDARNLDVYLQRDLPREERRKLKQRREQAYDGVIAAMESPRFRRLMLDLVAWAALGAWRDHANAQRELAPYLNHRIDRLWAKVSHAKKLAKADDEKRHRLRIQIKKLRYALEFAEALHAHAAEEQKQFGKAVQDLQESLGHLNDAVVARSLVIADEWPIVPHEPSAEERASLKEAEDALARLRRIGAYWKNSGCEPGSVWHSTAAPSLDGHATETRRTPRARR